MVQAGDGKPRSETRRSPYQVNVRLTAEEWEQLHAQAEEWNRCLPSTASASARMTVPRLLRTAAFRRKRPPALVAVGLSAEALAEFKAARADMARLGNLFKAWLEYGNGVFEGKGETPLIIQRGPMGVEKMGVRDVLEAMKAAAMAMEATAKQEGDIRESV